MLNTHFETEKMAKGPYASPITTVLPAISEEEFGGI